MFLLLILIGIYKTAEYFYGYMGKVLSYVSVRRTGAKRVAVEKVEYYTESRT